MERAVGERAEGGEGRRRQKWVQKMTLCPDEGVVRHCLKRVYTI